MKQAAVTSGQHTRSCTSRGSSETKNNNKNNKFMKLRFSTQPNVCVSLLAALALMAVVARTTAATDSVHAEDDRFATPEAQHLIKVFPRPSSNPNPNLSPPGASGAVSWSNSGELAILAKKSGLGARMILHPPEVRFAFGFFTTQRPGVFVLAVYLYPYRSARHRRRVWCASDDHQVPILVGEDAKLELGKHGLLLLDARGKPVWFASTSSTSSSSSRSISSSSVAGLELRSDGNLVLKDEQDAIVWESFRRPVDVLVPGQMLHSGMALVSGPYRLSMESAGLVLYHGTSRVWTWNICSNRSHSCNLPVHATLSASGLHLVHGGGSHPSCSCAPASYDPIRVLSGHSALALLLSDAGVIHVDVECSESDSLVSRSQRLLSSRRHSCQFSDGERPCSICSNASNCRCPANITAEQVHSLLASSDNASQNSVHSQGHVPGASSVGPGRSLLASLSLRKQTTIRTLKYKATVAISGFLGTAALTILAVLCAEKKPVKKPGPKNEIKDIFPSTIPQKFSYARLKKITDNFSKQLGDGGFGGVYEGRLKDGTRVAVKVLEQTSTQGEKEFKAEMTTMASIRHINILQLRGYCAEKKHRVLVYDFMPNGSLDRWLFSAPGKEGILDWPKRFSIAVGTAKGLAYLHEECNQQIIHLDVKPENILLDSNYIAKVADFGLSKLIDRDKSKVITNMRGTPGYLAPEWMHHSSVTTKADVYSFGMVLLELICGRETIDLTKGSEQWYLPAWAVRMVEEGRALELVDDRLQEEIEFFYGDDAKRSIRTALCCIQEDPVQRPKMSRIVQMLEGVIEPKIPQLSRLPLQPATAASRVKDKLAALADAISQEENSFHPFAGVEPVGTGKSLFPSFFWFLVCPQDGAFGPGNEVSFNAWGLNSGPVAGQTRTILKARNQPCIPPWPLKGDVVMVRGSGKGGEFAYAVIRDVKVRTQQVRLALLQRVDDTKWTVSEEESIWRQWSVMVRTLEFWVPVKWTTLSGFGPQKFPVEWDADQS